MNVGAVGGVAFRAAWTGAGKLEFSPQNQATVGL